MLILALSILSRENFKRPVFRAWKSSRLVAEVSSALKPGIDRKNNTWYVAPIACNRLHILTHDSGEGRYGLS